MKAQSGFSKHLAVVTLFHGVLIGLLWVLPAIPGCSRPPEPPIIPLDLVVEVPPGDEMGEEVGPEPEVTPQPEIPEPEPEPVPEVVTLKPPPKPKPKPIIEKPPPGQIVAATPTVAPTDYVAPPPPEPEPAPVIEAPPPAPMPLPISPVALAGELSVACPERSAPTYPAQSRRFSEEGTVILRVELDETGRVATARVNSSSGHGRLDGAALAAVKTWRCTAAQRNGQPVRAVALQAFKFVLRGN